MSPLLPSSHSTNTPHRCIRRKCCICRLALATRSCALTRSMKPTAMPPARPPAPPKTALCFTWAEMA
eukprot:9192818-Alexandrium_andersonii.AAC.1